MAVAPARAIAVGTSRGARPPAAVAIWRVTAGSGCQPPPTLAKAGAAGDPEALADDLTLVLEGMLASAQALGNGGPAARGRALAEKILDGAARTAAPSGSSRGGGPDDHSATRSVRS